MILSGDEMGRTQGGNNNAWCQDNEISWQHWDLDDEQRDLLAFTQRLIAMRKEHPVFRRRRFLAGESVPGELPDAWWFRSDGRKMARANWDNPDERVLGLFLNGQAMPEVTRRGERITDDSFLVLVNGHHETVTFTLPAMRFGKRWCLEISTTDPHHRPRPGTPSPAPPSSRPPVHHRPAANRPPLSRFCVASWLPGRRTFYAETGGWGAPVRSAR